MTTQPIGGTVLADRYELGPLVGFGGTAEVYRARDRATGRLVAVKLFTTGSGPDAQRRELDLLARLRHPGLVGVLDGGRAGARSYVVMEFFDGRTLADRLADGPLPAEEVVRLGRELAEVLAFVHRHGVVHRDVKPGNVLLDGSGRVRLTDFGIARLVDATRLTPTGQVVGTAAYMAPEQVLGARVGPPADVYALGLLLLEAGTGRREFDGGQVESALARLLRAPRVPEHLPPVLGTAIAAMTAREPGDRPRADRVRALLADDLTATVVDARRRSHALVRALGTTALVVLVGGVVAAADPAARPGPDATAPPVVADLVPPLPAAPAVVAELPAPLSAAAAARRVVRAPASTGADDEHDRGPAEVRHASDTEDTHDGRGTGDSRDDGHHGDRTAGESRGDDGERADEGDHDDGGGNAGRGGNGEGRGPAGRGGPR